MTQNCCCWCKALRVQPSLLGLPVLACDLAQCGRLVSEHGHESHERHRSNGRTIHLNLEEVRVFKSVPLLSVSEGPTFQQRHGRKHRSEARLAVLGSPALQDLLNPGEAIAELALLKVTQALNGTEDLAIQVGIG